MSCAHVGSIWHGASPANPLTASWPSPNGRPEITLYSIGKRAGVSGGIASKAIAKAADDVDVLGYSRAELMLAPKSDRFRSAFAAARAGCAQ